MWTNTIGSVDPQAGSNSVIEAAINAPQFGGGRAARRAAAQEAVAQTGEGSCCLVAGDHDLSTVRCRTQAVKKLHVHHPGHIS